LASRRWGLIMAAEGRGPLLHARVGMLRAMKHGRERVYSDRKESIGVSWSWSGMSEKHAKTVAIPQITPALASFDPDTGHHQDEANMVNERLSFERLYRDFYSGCMGNINLWRERTRYRCPGERLPAWTQNGPRVESGAVRYAPDQGWGLKIEPDQ
jgi:hypothetical protein